MNDNKPYPTSSRRERHSQKGHTMRTTTYTCDECGTPADEGILIKYEAPDSREPDYEHYCGDVHAEKHLRIPREGAKITITHTRFDECAKAYSRTKPGFRTAEATIDIPDGKILEAVRKTFEDRGIKPYSWTGDK